MQTRGILIPVGADYEDMELWYPRMRIIEAAMGVTVAGPESEAIYNKYRGKI